MAMAIVASIMTMPAVARTARSLTTGNRAGRPQIVRLSNLWPKLFQGDVSRCALSGLGSEELAGTVTDWAIVDSLSGRRAVVVLGRCRPILPFATCRRPARREPVTRRHRPLPPATPNCWRTDIHRVLHSG